MVSRNNNEVEAKITYNNRKEFEKWLRNNSFKLHYKKEIKDTYFSVDSLKLSESKSFYRIREVVGEYTELTFKDSFKDNKGVRTKREINVSIDNAENMKTIISTLGCRVIRENASKREYWKRDRVTVELIDYYKPVKLNYAEVEGESNEKVRKTLMNMGSMVNVVGDEIFIDLDN